MDISQNIKSIRERKGLSQASIADMLQMERTNYHRLEKRGNKMTIEQLQSIADALGVSLGEVLGYENKVDDDQQDRVKELEKEVGYLKQILDAYDRAKVVTKRMVEQDMRGRLTEAAIELNVGTWMVVDNKTLDTIAIKGTWLDVEKHPDYDKFSAGMKDGTYSVDLLYSKEEVNQMRQKVLEKDFDYWSLLNDLGFIEDEDFQKLIMQKAKLIQKEY